MSVCVLLRTEVEGTACIFKATFDAKFYTYEYELVDAQGNPLEHLEKTLSPEQLQELIEDSRVIHMAEYYDVH